VSYRKSALSHLTSIVLSSPVSSRAPYSGEIRFENSRNSRLGTTFVSFPIRMCRVPTLQEDELFCGCRAGVGGNTKHESGRLGSRQVLLNVTHHQWPAIRLGRSAVT
jgi:hypothetical protein